MDQNAPRSRWSLGRVVKVYPGQDTRVRTAEVKTRSSESLVRPVSKLCMLEESN